jgi:hypothetical protein
MSPSLTQGLAEQEKAGTTAAAPDKTQAGLRAEAESLEEVLKSQSRPRNLVVVKKAGTPVVESASLSAKTLFLASAHDEFEMLDFNRDWVHVHISGLSRGWIWRNNLEMPEGIPDNDMISSAGSATVSEIFHMAREEEAPFPGDWAPLRGKRVKIISVDKIGVYQGRAAEQLCGFSEEGAGFGRNRADLRFGRRRNDCRDVSRAAAMEGW